MKTLDEVIKALDWCINNDSYECDECPYDKEEEGCHHRNLDALHYLREYRETVTNCKQLEHIGDVNEMFVNRLYGTWIPVESPTVNGRCSVCGYESHLYENDVYGEHYCPNCGAWLRLT